MRWVGAPDREAQAAIDAYYVLSDRHGWEVIEERPAAPLQPIIGVSDTNTSGWRTCFASGASMCLLLRYFRWNSPDRRWWTGSALILLFFSSLSVAATGHLGATLSHVHQVEISKSNH